MDDKWDKEDERVIHLWGVVVIKHTNLQAYLQRVKALHYIIHHPSILSVHHIVIQIWMIINTRMNTCVIHPSMGWLWLLSAHTYMHTYSGWWHNIISSTIPPFSFMQSHPTWMINKMRTKTCSSIHLWGGCGYRVHTFTCLLIAGDDITPYHPHPSIYMYTSQRPLHNLIQCTWSTKMRWKNPHPSIHGVVVVTECTHSGPVQTSTLRKHDTPSIFHPPPPSASIPSGCGVCRPNH